MKKKHTADLFSLIKRHRRGADLPYLKGGTVLAACFVVSMILFGASWFQSTLLLHNNFAAVISAVLVDLANADRVQNGSPLLAVNRQLVTAAQAKADDMAARGYFSHNTPEGREPWSFIREAGYEYRYAGENLAVRFADSVEVEQAWLNSELHRKNILDGRFTEIGIATAYGFYQGQQTTFVVQMFGALKKSATTSSTNKTVESGVGASSVVEARAKTRVLGASYAPPAVLPTAIGEATLAEHIFASPQTYLRYGYGVMAALILTFGFLMFSYELRQRHFRHSVYAMLLCFAILALLYIADAQLFVDPHITTKDPLTTTGA